MITTARIRALKQSTGLSWITCQRASAINKLAVGGGPHESAANGPAGHEA
jgi:hypothetical protein